MQNSGSGLSLFFAILPIPTATQLVRVLFIQVKELSGIKAEN